MKIVNSNKFNEVYVEALKFKNIHHCLISGENSIILSILFTVYHGEIKKTALLKGRITSTFKALKKELTTHKMIPLIKKYN